MAWISRWVLGRPTSLAVAQAKLMLALLIVPRIWPF